MKGLFSLASACFLLSVVLPSIVKADEALPAATAHALELIVPKQRWVTRVELRHTGFDHVYDNQGNRRPAGDAYDRLALDGAVFPMLALLGPSASLGTTDFRSEVSIERVELTVGYGLTDDLTLGLILPFGRSTNRVDLALAGGNVGWNPFYDPQQAPSPGNFPFAPVGGGALAPFETEDLQQVLTSPAFGYQYQPVGDSTVSGIADPTVGGLWRFLRRANDSAILGFGYRIGVMDEDPDDLFDVPLDDGSDDLVGQVEYFRDLGRGFDLRALIKRTEQLTDEVTVRVPAAGELLAPAASKETLKRDLGDYWEYDLELGRRWGDWRLSGTWHRYDKARDRYRSDTGTDTRALEANTAIRGDQWRVACSWSGIRAWRERRLPLPLAVKLELQETYDGRNMSDVRDLYLIVTAMF